MTNSRRKLSYNYLDVFAVSSSSKYMGQMGLHGRRANFVQR